MRAFVVDASVHVSALNPHEPFHPQSRDFVALARRGVVLVSPEILLPEVAAAVARALGNQERALRIASAIRAMEGVRLVAVTESLADQAAAVAARCRVRGCDAVYLALARETGAPLVTLDRQQLERGRAMAQTLTPEEALKLV